MKITIQEVQPSALAELREKWQALAEASSEPNCCYEPWMVLPALSSLPPKANSCFLFIWGEGDNSSALELLGFFPFERRNRYGSLPIPHLRLWRYEHCLYCSPLVRRGFEDAVSLSLYDWLESNTQCVVWNFVGVESSFLKSIKNLSVARHAVCREEIVNRVIVELSETAEEYSSKNFSKSFRKELGRKERRLKEQGDVSYEFCTPESVSDNWLEEFFVLEAKGWKGKRGSALASTEESKRFMRDLFLEGKKMSRISTAALRLNGECIAASCNLIGGQRESLAFKTAYDEEYSKYSPALLLEREHIAHLHQVRTVDWIDTCVPESGEMAKRLGSGVRSVTTCAMGFTKLSQFLIANVVPIAEVIRARIFGKEQVRL